MSDIFCLSEDWEKISKTDELIPYGVGRIGRRVISTLVKEYNVPFLIDNSGHSKEAFGLNILFFEDAIEYIRLHNCKIVVTTVSGAYQDICKQLQEHGFVENRDFCLFERFVMEWNLRWKNRCVLSKIDTVITTNCSLRCYNCNMFISDMQCHDDVTLDELKRNFDIFFSNVDYVYEYTLLGGEPFLHKQLAEILIYLNDEYGEKIGKINLISNGTIIPKQDILDIMKKNRVMVNISDYTGCLNYSEKLKDVENAFKDNDIEYYTIPNNVWKDVMYPKYEYHASNPKEHMRLCGHGTHSVDGGRIYWCDPAFAAERFLGFESKDDDSLDLERNKQENTKYDANINIMRYILGDVNERGYMSLCERCAGIGWDNDTVVMAGKQVKGESEQYDI